MLSVPMGIFSETFPIFGSRAKSYLFLASLLQIGACLNVAIQGRGDKNMDTSAWNLTMWTWLCFIGMTWVDTIVGGLLVRESRVDP